MTLTVKPLARQKVKLFKRLEIEDTTMQVVGRFKIQSTDSNLVGKQFICISPATSSSEGVYINVTTQPTLVPGQTNVYSYSLITRGLHSDNETVPPTLFSSLNRREHEAGATVAIISDPSLYKELQTMLLGSIAATLVEYVSFQLYDKAAPVQVVDGRAYFIVPAGYNGHDLTALTARVITAGTTGTTDIQIHNVTRGQDMLSTKLTIDSGGTSSETAATPYVINTSNDHIANGDLLRIDIDAVSTTAPKGLLLTLTFTNPT